MANTLDDAETDRLAHAVAKLTGETLTDAVRSALSERLERVRLQRGHPQKLVERLMEIGAHCAALPDIDRRTPDDLAGCDEAGP